MYHEKRMVHYGNVDRLTPPVDATTTLHLLKINEVPEFLFIKWILFRLFLQAKSQNLIK